MNTPSISSKPTSRKNSKVEPSMLSLPEASTTDLVWAVPLVLAHWDLYTKHILILTGFMDFMDFIDFTDFMALITFNAFTLLSFIILSFIYFILHPAHHREPWYNAEYGRLGRALVA